MMSATGHGFTRRSFISLKRIRRHAATRWSSLFAAACTVALPMIPAPIHAAGVRKINWNRGLPDGYKQALTPAELKQVEAAEKAAAHARRQPDARPLTRKEMAEYRGGQVPSGGQTPGQGIGGGGTGGVPSAYRNKYMAGVFPWQRQFRDVNLSNGDLFKSFTDIQVAPARGAGLALQRTYNSLDDRIGPFGVGWTHAYDIRMEEAAADQGATDYSNYSPRTDFFGGKHSYHRDADGLYSPPAYLYDELSSAYDAFLVDGPTKSLEDTEIGMDGTVKHFFLNGSGGAAGKERACDTITDRYGNQTVLSYGQTITLADGSTKKVLTSVTDPSGRALIFAWTNLGTVQQPVYRITSVTGPLYSVTYAYGADYNLASVTLDPGGLGRTTSYTYTSVTGQNGTAAGLLASITDPLGHTVSYSYQIGPGNVGASSQWACVSSVTEPAGLNGTLTWNIGLAISFTSPSWMVASVQSNTTPALYFGVWSDMQLRKRYLFLDQQHNLSLHRSDYDTVSPGNNVSDDWTVHTIDHLAGQQGGGILYQTHSVHTYGPHGNELTCAFDGTSGNTSTNYFDGSQYFQKSSVVDYAGHTTSFNVGTKTDSSVGNRGSVLWVRDARYGTTGAQFNYTYNSYGQKLTETNLNGVETDYTYGDQWGNLTQVVQDPGAAPHLARTTTMVYDAGGRVTSSTDPMGRTSNFTYNVLGQPLTASFPATASTPAETVTYSYDANGRLSTVTDNRGTTTMAYEAGSDRVSSVTDPVTGAIGYTYNIWGQRLTMTLPGGGTWTYLYDNGRMMPKDDPNSICFVLHKITDDQGRICEYEMTQGGLMLWAKTNETFTNGNLTQYMETDYTYQTPNVNDPSTRGFLKTISNLFWVKNPNTQQWTSSVLTQNDYTYNSDGMRLTNQISNPGGVVRTENYGYDELYRLTSINYGDGQTQTYAFDAMGNRLTKNDSVSGNESYAYNSANMLLTRGASSYTNDLAGNTLTGGGRTNTWDSQNRLVQCVYNGTTSNYTYASDGLRHRSQVGATTTDFVLDASLFIRELQGGTVKATYLVGGRGPEYRRDDSTGAIRWYVFDGLGSVLGEVDWNGSLQASRTYDVYGLVRTSAGTSTAKQKYCGALGHPSEDESGLVYMRARYMDPTTGRFESQDPDRKTANWLLYGMDNPTNVVDASGREGFPISDLMHLLAKMWPSTWMSQLAACAEAFTAGLGAVAAAAALTEAVAVLVDVLALLAVDGAGVLTVAIVAAGPAAVCLTALIAIAVLVATMACACWEIGAPCGESIVELHDKLSED